MPGVQEALRFLVQREVVIVYRGASTLQLPPGILKQLYSLSAIYNKNDGNFKQCQIGKLENNPKAKFYNQNYVRIRVCRPLRP